MGSIFRSVSQPPVIGEIIAGIVLGPSLLGRLAPGAEGYLFPAFGRAVSQYHRAGRRHPLHVPGRARARSRAASQTRPRHRRDLSREHHRAVPARRDDRALSLSKAVDQRRAVHLLLAFPGRLDVRDCISGAGENPDRSRDSQNPHGCDRADLRRGRRRYRVVHARIRGQRGASAGGGRGGDDRDGARVYRR